jgi:hypothetical protein
VHTRDRLVSRTATAGKIDRTGLALVAAGYVVMTLGILEIGGLFNVRAWVLRSVGRMRVDVRTRGKAGVRREGRVEEGARRTLSGRRLGGASDPR